MFLCDPCGLRGVPVKAEHRPDREEHRDKRTGGSLRRPGPAAGSELERTCDIGKLQWTGHRLQSARPEALRDFVARTRSDLDAHFVDAAATAYRT
jgi:hypothetical protein